MGAVGLAGSLAFQVLLLSASLASGSAWPHADMEDMELPPHHPWVGRPLIGKSLPERLMGLNAHVPS
jgi:hypothetical protein